MSDVQAYQDALKAAVRAAIDSELFYNADVNSFVAKHCAVPDPARENFLGIVDVPVHDLPAARKVEQEMEAKVAAAQRGTWAIMRKTFEKEGRTSTVHSPMLSDGSGSLATGCRNDTSYEPPTYEGVLRRAFEMEVYLARRELEAEDLKARNREAIASGRVSIETEFRDVTVNSQKFSRAKVVGVDAETGQVKIELAKRGSRRRWSCEVGAAALSPAPSPETADLADGAKAPAP